MDRARALLDRYQAQVVAALALAFTVIPLCVDGGLHGFSKWIGAICTVAGAVCIAWWRRYPNAVLVIGPLLLLVCGYTGPGPSNFLLAALFAYGFLIAERFSGRSAWVAGLACLGYLLFLYVVTDSWESPGLLILISPGFVAGTALRLRRETAEQLVERGRELEMERELFAEVSVRNERARIASELHDIVGHALSVMVVQAAAGQRLVAQSPEAAIESLGVIADSARQGRADLQRLIDLLAGTEVASPDLSLIDEVVKQAARSGLRVTCRLEGSREGLQSDAAHAAFRVVQESLTNALRHAPGAEVRVLIRSEVGGRAVTVRVENDAAPRVQLRDSAPMLSGTGRGLIGLRERVLALGGTFSAGPAPSGGWAVEAQLASSH